MTADPDTALTLVKQYATDMTTDKGARDDAMRAARMLGATFRQIADAASMSPQGVRKCLAKRVMEDLDNSVHKSTIVP